MESVMIRQSGKYFNGMAILACAFLLLLSGVARAERIKDLASVQGVRSNQLVGYGLVVGLDGTGDQTTQTPFTTQSIINMLAQLGTTLPTTQSLQLKNVAAVNDYDEPAALCPNRPADRCHRFFDG